MLELLLDPHAWAALITLTVLEIVLGIGGSTIDFKKDLGLTDKRFGELHDPGQAGQEDDPENKSQRQSDLASAPRGFFLEPADEH